MAGHHREIVSYKECRRNHALAAGGNTVDGCREFAAAAGEDGDAALLCQACGCHRSFHRREVVVIRAHHVQLLAPAAAAPAPQPQAALVPVAAMPVMVLHRAPANMANPNRHPPQQPQPPRPPLDERERARAEIDGEIEFEGQKPTVQVMKRTRIERF